MSTELSTWLAPASGSAPPAAAHTPPKLWPVDHAEPPQSDGTFPITPPTSPQKPGEHKDRAKNVETDLFQVASLSLSDDFPGASLRSPPSARAFRPALSAPP